MNHQSSATYTVDTPLRNGNGGNGNGNSRGNRNVTGLKWNPIPIGGRSLAHRYLTASERAGIAAQLVLGEARLVRPTITQVVPIVRVSPPYVQLALRLTEKTRARVAAGELSLVDAAKANGLLSAWLAASPAEKAAFGIAAGVNNVWDDAIAPSI
jgi:hypothetical protein